VVQVGEGVVLGRLDDRNQADRYAVGIALVGEDLVRPGFERVNGRCIA